MSYRICFSRARSRQFLLKKILRCGNYRIDVQECRCQCRAALYFHFWRKWHSWAQCSDIEWEMVDGRKDNRLRFFRMQMLNFIVSGTDNWYHTWISSNRVKVEMSNVAIISSPFLHLSTLRMHISLCKHRVFRPCSFRSTTKFPSGSSHYKPLVHPNRPCTHLARLDCSCIHSHRLETDPKSKPMRHIRHRRSLSTRDNAFYSFSVSFGWYSLDPVALGT